MIKEALAYLTSLKANQMVVVNGENYSTEQLNHIKPVLEPSPSSLSISTLTGLVDYIKGNVDNIDRTLIIHVISPTEVQLFSELKTGAVRDHFLRCTAWTPKITYGQFMDVENFNIMIQSCFLQNDHSGAVLKVIGNIVEENVSSSSDDGVSQKVTGRAGIVKNAEIEVPNPVILCPFRTFAEVDQPESKFVFRMKTGPEAAIFEADGGIWKLFAMQAVKEYLQEKLEGLDNIKVIS